MTKSEVVKLLLEEIDRCRRAPDLNGCDMKEEWQRTIDVCSVAVNAIREQEAQENLKPLSAFLAPMDSYKGLKRKFLVFKSDTGEMVENCFVLRPDKDPAAVAALRAYAEATDNDTLSVDIINWVGAECNDPLTLDELRQMKDEPVYLKLFNPLLNSGWHIIKAVTSDKIIYREWQSVFTLINGLGIDYNLYRHKPEV